MSKPYARPAQVDDCAELAANLRQADLTELSLGHSPTPYDALMRGFAFSDEPISVIDSQGAVVAMMGVVPLGPGVGGPWMLASDGLEKIKWPFLRECKARLLEIHKRYPFLHNQVWQGNTVHIRWLKWLGFTVSPVPVDRPLFLPFWKLQHV